MRYRRCLLLLFASWLELSIPSRVLDGSRMAWLPPLQPAACSSGLFLEVVSLFGRSPSSLLKPFHKQHFGRLCVSGHGQHLFGSERREWVGSACCADKADNREHKRHGADRGGSLDDPRRLPGVEPEKVADGLIDNRFGQSGLIEHRAQRPASQELLRAIPCQEKLAQRRRRKRIANYSRLQSTPSPLSRTYKDHVPIDPIEYYRPYLEPGVLPLPPTPKSAPFLAKDINSLSTCARHAVRTVKAQHAPHFDDFASYR